MPAIAGADTLPAGVKIAPMELIDTHCHLDVGDFDADRDAVLARARRAGVVAQLVPAIHAAGWDFLLALCAAHEDLHPALAGAPDLT